MACFLAPAAEAIVVTVAAKVIKAKEKQAAPALSSDASRAPVGTEEVKIRVSTKLMWLARLLWGGVFLLAYEHLWHGEVVPFFPFLTAMNDPGETQVMLGEIASVGGSMCVWLTLVWAVAVFAASRIIKRGNPLGAAA